VDTAKEHLQLTGPPLLGGNFYATAKPDAEPVWTGRTTTLEASSALKAIKGLVKIVGKDEARLTRSLWHADFVTGCRKSDCSIALAERTWSVAAILVVMGRGGGHAQCSYRRLGHAAH